MGLNSIGQNHFAHVRADDEPRNEFLDASNQEAFLALRDPQNGNKQLASDAVFNKYAADGLRDYKGIPRVVRTVTIPKGTRVYNPPGSQGSRPGSSTSRSSTSRMWT